MITDGGRRGCGDNQTKVAVHGAGKPADMVLVDAVERLPIAKGRQQEGPTPLPTKLDPHREAGATALVAVTGKGGTRTRGESRCGCYWIDGSATAEEATRPSAGAEERQEKNRNMTNEWGRGRRRIGD